VSPERRERLVRRIDALFEQEGERFELSSLNVRSAEPGVARLSQVTAPK